jgi:hypothetical protein
MVLSGFYTLAANFESLVRDVNEALANLRSEPTVENGISVSIAVLGFISETDRIDALQVIDSGLLKLPNSERQDP